MNRELLRRFFHKTREWSRAHRGAALMQLASEALVDFAEVDSGFFVYRRRMTVNYTPVLNQSRVFMPWGVFQGDDGELDALLELVQRNYSALSQVMERWILAEDIPSGELRTVWAPLGLLEFGVWPIISREEVIGLMVVARTSAVSSMMTTEMSHAIVDSCAAQVAFALDIIMSLRVAEEASRTDLLTGILNRRGIELQWDDLVARSRRTNRQLILCVSDVDDFKAINDRLGHPAGDDVLCGVASTLRSFVRSGEIVGRLGGDEFLYAYFEESADTFSRVRALQKAVTEAIGGHTLSVGAAVLGVDGDDFRSLYRCADERLYENKRYRQASLHDKRS